MMRRNLLILFVLLSISISNYAQRSCPAHDLMLQQNADPAIENQRQQIEQFTQNFVANNPNSLQSAVITIPIVFHVVYRTAAENISDAQIMSQLQVLNDDFRRLNSDVSNTPSDFSCVAADVELEFCLAQVDPDGNPTTGITRTSTSVNGHGTNDSVKFDAQGGKDAWPSCDYLNFWVCNIGGGILGYAQFPGGPANTDGVVNGYQYTGTIGTATAPFNLGRTATHEVGHWLNLRHIWGDGNCNADDFVADTPLAGNENYTGTPCTYPGPNSCTDNQTICDGARDYADMFQNYMDYSDDACMNLFTEGQKARMLALFAAGGARECLVGKDAIKCTVPTCTDGIQNGNETDVDCGGPDCPACPPSCTDGIMNQDETGVDCGGTICPACPTCNDGIMNQDETGIDCGGTICPACPPTCNDGIMNQDETGIDCGGTVCPPCAQGSCNSPTILNCGDNVSGDTNNGVNNYSTYLPDGYTGWNGPEIVYSFTLTDCSTVTIDMTYPGATSAADLDIFLFDVCDPTQNYIDASFNAPDVAEQIIASLEPGTYYIIIDGDNTDAGPYNLSLSCVSSSITLACEVPYDGDTAGTGNDTETYNGAGNTYTGQEELFQYTHAGGTITITLSNMSRNHDMIIMDDCNAATANLITELRAGGTNDEVYTNANLPAGTYYIYVESRRANRTGTWTLEVTPCSAEVLLSPKVFLQGPLTGSTMNVALTGMLPTTSPYADAKPLGGAMPANAVDWIWIELRSDNTAAPATTDGQSGILLDDGTVVDVDGMPLKFNVTPGQSWFIMVQHRNHLGIMTNSAILLN